MAQGGEAIQAVQAVEETTRRVEEETEAAIVKTSVPAVLKLKTDELLAVAKQMQARLTTLVDDPKFQVVSISSGGSALALAAVGGGCGMMAGSATGLAIGVVPSLLTFGLSIPVCCVAGGAIGTGAGALVGGSTGFVGGGVAGGVAYAYRVEIKENGVYVKAKIVDIASRTKTKATDISATTRTKVVDTTKAAQSAVISCVRDVSSKVTARTSEFSARSRRVAADPHFQVSAASAAGGAVVLAAGGGAAGLTAGTLTGAAIGVVPALFTFGLSIPVGAMIGGSAGLCLGAAAGGSAGLVGGGAAGYGSYAKRNEIRAVVHSAKARAMDSYGYVQDRARDSAGFVKTKILGGGTGGTA